MSLHLQSQGRLQFEKGSLIGLSQHCHCKHKSSTSKVELGFLFNDMQFTLFLSWTLGPQI